MIFMDAQSVSSNSLNFTESLISTGIQTLNSYSHSKGINKMLNLSMFLNYKCILVNAVFKFRAQIKVN